MKLISSFKRKNRYTFKVFCLLLVLVITLNMTACGKKYPMVKATDLMTGISSVSASEKNVDSTFKNSMANFSINLFKKTSTDSENSLVSPVSVMLALAMTANGADKTTLSQMESVLGGGIGIETINQYLYSYVKNLPNEDKSKLNIANSIWFRDSENRLTVNKEFLQKNADYFGAQIYKSAFDRQTVFDINSWVNRKTEGLIDEIVEEINENDIMYLINALVFEAEWKNVYYKENIYEDKFTDVHNNSQKAEFMSSQENIYLSDYNMTGFIKPYYNDKYSFAAMLPNEGKTVNDYISGMTGTSFLSVINNAQQESVTVSLPKFGYDYEIVMNDALKALGINDAFSSNDANFSKLGKSEIGNIYIGEVLHKTFISVDELGTKAGAVTKVAMKETSAVIGNRVVLNRPFIYAIIDNSTNLPIFIGTVLTLENR